MTGPVLNPDFLDLLHAFTDTGVRFVVVGAHALAVHGVPRATGDLDVLVEPTVPNGERVLEALRAFGAPTDKHGIRAEDFAIAGVVYQLGLPPRRIGLLTSIEGVDFPTAWSSRVEVALGSLVIPFLGRDALIANKRASGRTKDLADLEALEHRGG